MRITTYLPSEVICEVYIFECTDTISALLAAPIFALIKIDNIDVDNNSQNLFNVLSLSAAPMLSMHYDQDDNIDDDVCCGLKALIKQSD